MMYSIREVVVVLVFITRLSSHRAAHLLKVRTDLRMDSPMFQCGSYKFGLYPGVSISNNPRLPNVFKSYRRKIWP